MSHSRAAGGMPFAAFFFMRLLLLAAWLAPAAAAWFEPNLGQAGGDVLFTGPGVVFRRGTVEWRGLRIRVEGGSPGARIEGERPAAGRGHYLGRERPVVDVPRFAAVRWREVYPGIDLRFYFAAGGLEYDLILAPGADLARVALRFDGLGGVKLQPGGGLATGPVRHRRPVAWQGGRTVEVSYRLRGRAVAFECLDCDPAQPLTVDPLLVYSTYWGGPASEAASAVAVDAAGSAYLAAGNSVTKYDAAGSAALFTTTVGPAGTAIKAMAVDSDGGIVLTGTTTASFPPTAGAYQTPNPSGFVARLAASGDRLVFASVFAGAPAALALDAAGNPVVAGTAAGDVQLLKLARDGSRALFSTRFGGSGVDQGRAVAVDAAGGVYVAGYTESEDFRTTPGTAQGRSRGGDGFVARFDAAGAQAVYSTYLGGSGADSVHAMAVDRDGGVVLAGTTESADFPGAAGRLRGGSDAFVTRLTASGALAWTWLGGGASDDSAIAVALDSLGRALAAGNSDSAGFPVTPGSLPSCRLGGPFLARLDRDGGLVDSTRLSGIGFDTALALAVDARDAAYVAGAAASRVFFSSPGAAQTRFGGGDSDAFLSKVELSRPPGTMIACLLNAGSFQPGNTTFFPQGTVAPGEIVSLFGVGLGPATPAGARLTASGAVATELEGTRVLFDGVAAPLLYASGTQVNAVVPFGLNASEVRVALQRGGASTGPIALPVAEAVPAVFTLDGSGTGQATVLNQDGSVNSPANPAARGSVVTFYATGLGRMAPAMADGEVAALSLPLPAPVFRVGVTMRGIAAEVLYAGAMPGAVAGAIQINARVPREINFGNSVPLTVTAGAFSSQLQITLAVN